MGFSLQWDTAKAGA